MALEEFLGLALGAAVLVFSLYALVIFSGVFEGESTIPTVAGLRALSEQVDTLAVDEDLRAIQTIPLQIDEGWTIVAFSRGEKSVKDKCGKIDIPRPAECREQSCLCAYEGLPDSIHRDKTVKSPIKCYVTSKVHQYYSLRGFDGLFLDPFWKTVKADWPVLNEQPPHAVYNSLGGDKSYPSALVGQLPKQLSHVVFHGACNAPRIPQIGRSPYPWGINSVYIEKLVDKDKKVHVLVTPVSPLTESRFTGEIRGLPFEDYIVELKKQQDAIYCELDDKVGCFDSERVSKMYQRMRELHNEKRVEDEELLYKLGSRLLRTHGAVASEIFRDLAAWHPNSKYMPEALYARMILTYPPENIAVPGSYTSEQRKKIEWAIKEADKLIENTEELLKDDKVTTERKDIARPFNEFGYYVRGLYYIGLNEYVKARDDIQMYKELSSGGLYEEGIIEGKRGSYVPLQKSWSYVIEKEPLE